MYSLFSKNRGRDRATEFAKLYFKLIGTMEFQRVPATPRLNIRCIQDPSKNGNYNVFVMEIRMPK